MIEKQELDCLCIELGIEHELSLLIDPKRNSMVDQFNVRMGKDALESYHFNFIKNLRSL